MFDEAFKHLLKHEGGFTSDSRDPGNAGGTSTNLGVTQMVWESWIGRKSNEKEMRALTPEKVAPLYKKKYWDIVKGDDLPSGVDYCVFDAAVNSGPGRAAKWLQEAVGAFPDGAIGPKTLAAVNAMNPIDVINAMCDTRQSFLEELVTFRIFGRGWTRRVSEVRQTALGLANETEGQ